MKSHRSFALGRVGMTLAVLGLFHFAARAQNASAPAAGDSSSSVQDLREQVQQLRQLIEQMRAENAES
ncbi:MAG TPA: hypothetical protein VE866_00210, partial [Candidatus Binatia bacterium]|nr:hypothetical protein [Candidatus Binatia bacterium]